MLQNANALASYHSSLNLRVDDRHRFVEISIIDSGLGYCGRWVSDHPELGEIQGLDLAAEYEVFKRCFTFRQTSSGSSTKGHGLPVVMDRLTRLKGFMRVRSGRLSLYRDFVAHPFAEHDTCDFFDWTSNEVATSGLTEMSAAIGVAITLLIPLEAKQ